MYRLLVYLPYISESIDHYSFTHKVLYIYIFHQDSLLSTIFARSRVALVLVVEIFLHIIWCYGRHDPFVCMYVHTYIHT